MKTLNVGDTFDYFYDTQSPIVCYTSLIVYMDEYKFLVLDENSEATIFSWDRKKNESLQNQE